MRCWTSGPETGTPPLFVQGNLVSGRWCEHVATHRPDGIRVVALDLRFGGTEPVPVDATRGLRIWSHDVAVVAEVLADHVGAVTVP